MPNRGKNDDARRPTGANYRPPSFSAAGARGQAGNRSNYNGNRSVQTGRAPSGRYPAAAGDAGRYPQDRRAPSQRRTSAGTARRPAEADRPVPRQNRYGETASPGVRRKAQNKSRAAKIYLFVAICAVAAAVVLALTVFFNVETIEVRGNSRYSSEQIIENSGISIGDNLLLMNKFKSVERIKENLIYVGDVVIRRSFPDTIVITVKEIAVAAAFRADSAYWLCDDGGMLLELSQTPPEGAAVVTGAELDEPEPGELFAAKDDTKQQPLEELFAALKNNSLFGSVRSIDITRIYDIQINYLDRYDVVFGKSGELDERCAKLRALIPQLEAQGNAGGKIDMSDGEIHFIADGT
jgi:cell division protein FtsQ